MGLFSLRSIFEVLFSCFKCSKCFVKLKNFKYINFSNKFSEKFSLASCAIEHKYEFLKNVCLIQICHACKKYQGYLRADGDDRRMTEFLVSCSCRHTVCDECRIRQEIVDWFLSWFNNLKVWYCASAVTSFVGKKLVTVWIC